MCIIVAKPNGIAMPNMDTLEECWYANPHGAGIMYAHHNQVEIIKGLMTWDAFRSELKSLSNRFDLEQLALVMHFRISTQAGVNPENTHPFPISTKPEKLTAQRTSSRIGGVAHNGIIPCCIVDDKGEKYSDTFYFVKDYMARYIHVPKQLKSKPMQEYLESVAKSKLAILLPNSELITLGEFTEENGILYSNDSYRPFRYYMSPYSYGYFNSAAWAEWDEGYIWDEFEWNNGQYRFSKNKKKAVTLYPCTEQMCIFDEDTCEYVPCVPGYDWYDIYGELWFYDKEDGEAYSLDANVYDENMRVVRPRSPGMRVMLKDAS